MKSCVECEGSKTTTLVVFGAIIFAALAAFLFIAHKEYTRDLEKSDESDLFRERSSSAAKRAFVKLKKAKSVAGPVFKILISYSQTICNFSSIFDIKFPPMFSWLTSVFGALANLDLINFMPLDCVFKSNYNHRMLVYTGSPIITAALIWLVMLQLRARSGKERNENHIHFSNWLFRIFLLGTFFVLPSATLKISST